jgi:tetratricopeptide (TPR) repeat protein
MDDISKARELERQASQAQREGRFADADLCLQQAIAIWTRLRGPDDIEVLNDSMNLAVAYRRRGEAARAVPILKRVVEMLPTCQDPDVPNLLLTAQNNLAAAYRGVNQLSLARQTWERCLGALDDAHGDRPHPERARVLDNLAVVLRDVHDLARSETLARRALVEWRALRGDVDIDTATSKATLGAALMEQGKLDEAELLLDDALQTHQATASDLAVAATLTLVGAVAAKRGNRERALASFHRALELTRRFFADTHPENRDLLRSIAALGSMP